MPHYTTKVTAMKNLPGIIIVACIIILLILGIAKTKDKWFIVCWTIMAVLLSELIIYELTN